MTIESAFLSMMPSVVTVYSKSSRDAYGKASFSASGTEVRCRVQQDRNVTSGSDKREIMETGVVYCYGVVTVSVDDKVVLPDGTVAKITQVTTSNDDVGEHHTAIRFGPG
jgi:hypothetical protein